MDKALRPITAHKTEVKGRSYTQCSLRNGDRYHVAFIPTKFAILGQGLKIRHDGQWIDGWVVTGVGKEADESFLDGMRNALKHHKDVSDI
jgi:hypothetical protein